LIDLNSFVLPACSGTLTKPDTHQNEAYKKLLASLCDEEKHKLTNMLLCAGVENTSLSFKLKTGNSFAAQKLLLANGESLFVFDEYPKQKQLPADSYVGYRKDSSVPGITADRDLQILHLNTAAEELLCSMNGSLSEDKLKDFFPPDALRFVFDIDSEVAFTTKVFNRQFEIRARQSQRVGQLIIRVDEKTSAVDIARILKKQVQPYQSLLKTLRIGFFQSTPSGKFLMVNEEMARILGYDSKDQFMEEVPDSSNLYVDSARREKLMEHLKVSGQIVDSETELYRRDGSVVKVSGTMVSVKNNSNEIILLQGTVLDISADSKKDRILKLLKNTLYDVNDSINIANLNDEIIFVNRAFTEMYGYEPEEVIGKKSSIFWSGVRAYESDPNVKEAVMQDGGYRSEVINRRKDGREMVVSLSASVVKDELDNPIAFIAIARDITKDRESEKALIEAKFKAEEASQLKSVILSNMSHELRTPLTGIIGFASILLEQLEDTKDNDTIYFLDNIKKAGERLLQTMNNILLLAELESRTVDLKFSETNLSNLLNQCRKINLEPAHESGLSIAVECDPDLKAMTDKNLLMQIMSPLIDNAIKFTEEGTIVLSAGLDDNQDFFISVKDTGIGIDSEYVEKIFEPFTQVSSGIRRKYQGSGLGLHISKRYVDMLEGRLIVISSPGGGAEFRIVLPAK